MDWSTFTWIDFIIIGIVGSSCLMSLWRGLLKEAMSLLIWVLAFISAMTFSGYLVPYFEPIFTNAALCYGICFVLVFFLTLVAGTIIGFLMGQLLMVTGLAGMDRILGGIFGFLRGMLIVTVLVTLLSMTSIVSQPFWTGSILLPIFTSLSQEAVQLVPSEIGHYFESSLDSGTLSDIYTKIKTASDTDVSAAKPLGSE